MRPIPRHGPSASAHSALPLAVRRPYSRRLRHPRLRSLRSHAGIHCCSFRTLQKTRGTTKDTKKDTKTTKKEFLARFARQDSSSALIRGGGLLCVLCVSFASFVVSLFY